MKNKIAILAMIIMLLILVVGCSSNQIFNISTTKSTAKVSVSAETKFHKPFEVVLIAKTDRLAWFDDMRVGVDEYNSKYANVHVIQVATDDGDAIKQAALFEYYINKDVDAICVIPIDPETLIPAITKAKAKGIIVVSHEAQSLAGIVDYDIEAIDNDAFGALFGQKLAEAMGGKGKYCGTVGSLIIQTDNQWFNAAVKYITENYPDMQLVQTEPFEDNIDSAQAYNLAKAILKAYPDLDGYLGMTVESGNSMCELLKETNNNTVKVSALALPSSNHSYIKEGWMTYGQCWRPADAGYATIDIAVKLLNGEKITTGINLEKNGYQNCVVANGIVYANAPIFLTKENIDELNF